MAPRIVPLSVEELREHGLELLHANHAESGHVTSSCDPDWPAYEKLEQLGMLFGFGAWIEHEKRNELVGYVICILAPHRQSQERFASVETLFVAEHARPLGLGLRLVRAAREGAEAREADGFFASAAPGSDFEIILRGLGFTLMEHAYLLRI